MTEDEMYGRLMRSMLRNHCTVEEVEWMIQRKWKKSEREVQRWFNKEENEITKEWLNQLWEYGTDEGKDRSERKEFLPSVEMI